MSEQLLRVGTTSYILFDDIIPNVRYLKDYVDDIELVLFESETASNLPSRQAIAELKSLAQDSNLTYTVHFPLDIYPGSDLIQDRNKFVDTLLKIVDLCTELDPFGYVLHLTPQSYGHSPAENVGSWIANLDCSLAQFLTKTHLDSRMFCVETLSYPFSLVQPLVDRYDLAVTLDIGHIWLMGYDPVQAVQALFQRTRICHLHGVANNVDHLSLAEGDAKQIEQFLCALIKQCNEDKKERVLTLEVFSEDAFTASLSLLKQSRAMMDWHWGGSNGNHT